MEFYCLSVFKDEFEKLCKKNSYAGLPQDLIDCFFGKKTVDILSGTRLNQSDTVPYIKKRLSGRGGFRLYFLVNIKKEKVYLMFVHPKTGSEGSDNITNESKAKIYKDVLEAIKTNNLFEVIIAQNSVEIKNA